MELNANMSVESPSEPAPPPAADRISPPLHTVVLVVDDEVQIRRLLRGCLERNGYEVVEAATGEQALAEAIRCQPNVILLDQVLPDMDGLVVLKRLREWSKAPVFILSVRDRDMDKVTALDHGANDYLSKPFSTSELLARLRVIQRYNQPSAKPKLFTSGELQVDLTTRSVRVRGQPVNLTGTEYLDPHIFCPTSRQDPDPPPDLARNLAHGRRRENHHPACLHDLPARQNRSHPGQAQVADHSARRGLPPGNLRLTPPCSIYLHLRADLLEWSGVEPA